MRSANITLTIAAALGTLVACGQDVTSAPPPTTTVTETVTRPPSTVTETVTVSPAKPAGEYPKFVDAKSVDPRFTQYSKLDRLVQLAPGVYAEPSASGELGTLEDYSSYLGLCVDVKRYSREHPGGNTCW